VTSTFVPLTIEEMALSDIASSHRAAWCPRKLATLFDKSLLELYAEFLHALLVHSARGGKALLVLKIAEGPLSLDTSNAIDWTWVVSSFLERELHALSCDSHRACELARGIEVTIVLGHTCASLKGVALLC
jgi:hypothetical protein